MFSAVGSVHEVAFLDGDFTAHDHMSNACCGLKGIAVGGAVENFARVENRKVGICPDADTALSLKGREELCHPFGGERSHLGQRRHEVDDASFTHIATKDF